MTVLRRGFTAFGKLLEGCLEHPTSSPIDRFSHFAEYLDQWVGELQDMIVKPLENSHRGLGIVECTMRVRRRYFEQAR